MPRRPQRVVAVLGLSGLVIGGLVIGGLGSQLAVATAAAHPGAAEPGAAQPGGLLPTLSPTPSPTASGGQPTCGGEQPPKRARAPWVCTFDDEFDATTGDPTALDRTRWLVQRTSTSGYATGPKGRRACYVDSPGNVSVSGGDLRLTALETAPFTCDSPGRHPNGSKGFTTSYTAGMVSTDFRFSQTFGRFEVRAKLPRAAVKGLQETLWLFPVDRTKYGGEPASGEIDFAEFYSQFPRHVIPYIHYRFKPKTQNPKTHTNIVTSACPIRPNHFNTYTAQWKPGTITLLANGKTCLVDKYRAAKLHGSAPFNQPFFVALTQALGIHSNAFSVKHTPLPASTLIDYVRVWK